MKIHDKFVIELGEVIKGYGNDPTVQDPFKFPCDYKFYEIEGVAICEKSFKKMKRLEDEINDVLDEVISEIMKLQTYKMFAGEDTVYIERDDVLALINKYKDGKV